MTSYFGVNLLSVALLANIFFHSERCPFVLFIVTFAVQKLLSVIKSCLFIFVLIFITLSSVQLLSRVRLFATP